MSTFVKALLLLVVSLTLGLAMAAPVQATGTELPMVDNPNACAMGRTASDICPRWYSLTEKPHPDACLDRPGAGPCQRWFSIAGAPPEMITLHGVHFEYDSSQIKEESRPILDREAKTLKKHADANVTIVGHTSSEGDASYNQKLSEERANAVKAYFIQKGISPTRLVTKGMGESLPVADNSTEMGREQNRRTDLLLN